MKRGAFKAALVIAGLAILMFYTYGAWFVDGQRAMYGLAGIALTFIAVAACFESYKP